MRNLYLFWCLFVIGIIVFVPFSYHILPDLGYYLSGFTCAVLRVLWQKDEISLASDADGLYFLAATWAIFCLFCTLFYTIYIRVQQVGEESVFFIKIKPYFTRFTAYYLAMQLLNYGFDKVFKHQFYLPEPNTLYTPVGFLDKDILYWTTIGLSYSYNVFTGSLEVLAGVLLLFRRTRLLGAILAFGLLAHIFMLNISFEITVKCLSAFLLLLSFSLILPYLGVLYAFFIKKEMTQLENEDTVFFGKTAHVLLKYSLVALIFIETLYPFFLSGYWNDDLAPRPPYHGAYQIQRFWSSDSLAKIHYKRLFFHRQPYFILQNENDTMQDYECDFDTKNQKLTLFDENHSKIGSFFVQKTTNYDTITLRGRLAADSLHITAFKIMK
jgi:hypothetical protein